MAAYNAYNGGQAKPTSGKFGCEERVKDFGNIFWLHAVAIVFYTQRNIVTRNKWLIGKSPKGVVVFGNGTNGRIHLNPSGPITNCFCSMIYQIQKNLVRLPRVGRVQGQVSGRVKR
jgi:hypothetical protein